MSIKESRKCYYPLFQGLNHCSISETYNTYICKMATVDHQESNVLMTSLRCECEYYLYKKRMLNQMVQLSMTLSETCLKMENMLAGDDILLLLSFHFCNSYQLERTIL